MEANVQKQLEKAVKSAVVIIPPENVWDQIQAIRKDHDKGNL